MGYSKERYQECRNEGLERNFDVYPTYNSLRDYRQNFLRPQGIFETNGYIQVPMQSVLDWQLGRLFLVEPNIQAKATRLMAEGWKIHCLVKYGADGCGNNSEYGFQKSLFASVLQVAEQS